MSKKNNSIFDRLTELDENKIKYYNTLINKKRNILWNENGIASLACIGTLFSLNALLGLKPEDYINPENYETLYNSLLCLGAAEAFIAIGIPLICHNKHKKLKQEIMDLKIQKSFLEGNYEVCVCNESEEVSQNPIIGCEQQGILSEAPQTLIRK